MQFPPDPGLVCGATIDHSLQMTRNYNCPDGFRVVASGITVDLAGYTVRLYNGDRQAFRVEATRVTIKNGSIVADANNNSRGVQVGPAAEATLSRLNITLADNNYGVVCDEGAGRLSMDNVAIQGGAYGLFARNCTLSVTSSSAQGARLDGFWVKRDDFSAPYPASFSGVTAQANAIDGIHLENVSATVTNSAFLLNGEDGIEHDGNQNSTIKLSGSRMTDNGNFGAYIFQSYVLEPLQGSLVSNNSFQRNQYGLVLRYPGPSGVMAVKGNEASYNRSDGFYADGVNGTGVTSGNTARSNVGSGFYANDTFSSASTDRCFGNGNNYSGGWTCTITSK